MTEYLSPDVNVESVASVTKTTVTTSKSTGGMIGILPRGITTKPVLVTSWLDAVRKFALGLDTPFMANSDLIYALYGFFQNGGKQVYLKRVVGTGAMKASLGVPDTTPTVTFSAIDEGDWGNQLSLVIVANAEDNTLFDVSVLYKDIQVESFSGLSNTATSDQYFVDIINQNSNYINVPSGTLSATAKKSFTGGKDDLGTITDTTYTDALKTFDFISDVRILAIPGQVSTVVSKALQDYVNGRTDTIIPLFDGPKSADVSAIKTFRKNLDCKGGLY
jgi:hypothetical protein